MRNKNIIIYITILFMIFLTGCGLWGDKTCARTINNPSEMPEIVFLNENDYRDVAEDGGKLCAITFYDKFGNHYISEDPYVCGLPYAEMVKEYAAGNLDDKIEYHMSCEVDEIFENYKKLCQLSRSKKLGMDYPEQVPQVETHRGYWYGLYYDKNGEIQTILLHEYGMGTDYYANDERANEIYEWYLSTFKRYKVIVEEEPVDEEKLADFDEIGTKYFKNQLLIRVNGGIERGKIEEIAEFYGAEIISFDEKKNEYIIEFKEEKTIENLSDIGDEIWHYSFVDRVSLHFYR